MAEQGEIRRIESQALAWSQGKDKLTSPVTSPKLELVHPAGTPGEQQGRWAIASGLACHVFPNNRGHKAPTSTPSSFALLLVLVPPVNLVGEVLRGQVR